MRFFFFFSLPIPHILAYDVFIFLVSNIHFQDTTVSSVLYAPNGRVMTTPTVSRSQFLGILTDALFLVAFLGFPIPPGSITPGFHPAEILQVCFGQLLLSTSLNVTISIFLENLSALAPLNDILLTVRHHPEQSEIFLDSNL